MKTWGWIGVIALGAVLVFAATSAVKTQKQPDSQAAYQEAKKETKQAWDATDKYMNEKREETRDQANRSANQARAEAGRAEQAGEHLRATGQRMAAAVNDARADMQSNAPSPQQVDRQLERVADDVQQDAQRDYYEQQVQAKLDQYNQRIKDLEDRARTADSAASDGLQQSAAYDSSAAKEELDRLIGDVKQKREAAQKRLSELKDAQDDAGWQSAKSSVEQSLTDLERAMEQTRDRIESRT